MPWPWILLFVLALLILGLQHYYYALQYVFFLRWPLILVLMLVLLPFPIFGDLFQNLFIIESRLGVYLAAVAAFLAAWVVMYTGFLLWVRTPTRVGLPFGHRDRDRSSFVQSWILWRHVGQRHRYQPNFVPDWMSQLRWRAILFSLPALSPIAAVLYRSTVAMSHAGQPMWRVLAMNLIMVLLAFGTAGVLRWIVARGWSWLQRRTPDGKRVGARIEKKLSELEKFIFGSAQETQDEPTWEQADNAIGSNPAAARIFTHSAALLLGAVSLVLYGLGYLLFSPHLGPEWLRESVPAIVYLLGFILLAAWVLPLLSHVFDKYRLPPEVVVLVGAVAAYGCFGNDHYYEIYTPEAYQCRSAERDDGRLDALAAAQKWAEGPSVVVAASGGGITAAYWTAVVLERLQEDLKEDDIDLAAAVRLVSATSGGSVGTMYYVDAFCGADGSPTAQKLVDAREAAGRSSLAAMGWGLLYPDLLRLALPFTWFNVADRGWALEERWAESLRSPQARLFRDWRPGVRTGCRPAVIFNAVVADTGERLLLSNLDLQGPSPTWRARSFDALYPRADIDVATAARLSATFPYVTPIARPTLPEACNDSAYHVADGGYYDNFGVLSAVEFLRAVDPALKDRRALLLEIRASKTDRKKTAVLDSAFRYQALGPADTMLAVRSTSQVARNELDVELAGIRSAVFELDLPAPLSWHLSQRKKAEIRAAWENEKIQKQVTCVHAFLTDSPAPEGCRGAGSGDSGGREVAAE